MTFTLGKFTSNQQTNKHMRFLLDIFPTTRKGKVRLRSSQGLDRVNFPNKSLKRVLHNYSNKVKCNKYKIEIFTLK